MSTASAAFGGPIVRTIDGESVEWPRLVMADYARLEERVRENSRFLTRQELDSCSVTSPGDRFVAMREASKVTAHDVNDYLGTSRGATAALEMSLAKTDRDKAAREALVSGLDIDTASTLARLLVGFLKEKTEAKPGTKEGGDGPNPPAPPAP